MSKEVLSRGIKWCKESKSMEMAVVLHCMHSENGKQRLSLLPVTGVSGN